VRRPRSFAAPDAALLGAHEESRREAALGHDGNRIDVAAQETIIQNISSFALYGFPESHAASFALIAYASAYFKVKYLAAFTCAILNNQPMGFYSPAVLVKDAQRHGLRVKPIDVQVSEWACTIEHEDNGTLSLRMGSRYAKGMREVSAKALIESRRKDGLFRASEDLALRTGYRSAGRTGTARACRAWRRRAGEFTLVAAEKTQRDPSDPGELHRCPAASGISKRFAGPNISVRIAYGGVMDDGLRSNHHSADSFCRMVVEEHRSESPACEAHHGTSVARHGGGAVVHCPGGMALEIP
jgi:hypothetical protein